MHAAQACEEQIFVTLATHAFSAAALNALSVPQAAAAAHAAFLREASWRTAALEALRPGGRLVINAIRKEHQDRDQMAAIRYEDHLWQEKEIKSVANVTARDIAEFLPIAAQVPLQVSVQTYSLDQANEALNDLRAGHVRGAKVLIIKTED